MCPNALTFTLNYSFSGVNFREKISSAPNYAPCMHAIKLDEVNIRREQNLSSKKIQCR